MTFEPDLESAASSALGDLARVALDRPVPNEAAERARFLARALDGGRGRRQVFVWAVPALAVAAALAVWLFLPRALRYEVVGAPAGGEYVSAPRDHAAALHFSDASSVEVSKGSQVRVAETSRTGARVLLERGRLSVHVVHQDRSDWTFVAGPYEVKVTGTRFELAWDPAREALELELSEGSVEVASPLSTGQVAVRAGQAFRAELGKQSLVDTSTLSRRSATEPVAPEAVAPKPGAEPAKAAPLAGRAAAPAAPLPSARLSWTELVAAGRFEAVLAEASTNGTAACVARCSAADLGALSDAARYKGRSELADQSLRALRERFAGTAAGRSAAFMLGRLREERGAQTDARSFYEQYLRESPGGPYSGEALAGKMRTTAATQGPAAAASVAREYLRLYPGGVHAKTARNLLGQP